MKSEEPSGKESLALFGGAKAVQSEPGDLFTWPIVTSEDEEAVLDVIRRRAMSGTDVTVEFEKEFARWQGTRHALAFSSGTASIQTALFACKVGVGTEIIAPSFTFWASCLQVFSLGGTVVFAEVEPDTLCLDPADIEHRVTDRTRAILVVHYLGHPADMDPILKIAETHGLKVIEDVSHAHGALYKGRKVGTLGHVGAMSIMSGKALAVGEAGMLVTDDREIYDRSLAWGHYERYAPENVETESLQAFAGLPLGGYKYRMHQCSSAMGRVQLRHYDERCAEIQRAMNRFWDLLEGVPGIRPHRPPRDSGTTMGGWYEPHGLYRPEELGGLSVTRFCEAVAAEGARCYPGANACLHLHPLFNECDVYGHGKPTRIAHAARDLRQPRGSLPVSESLNARTYGVPWFKKDRPALIAEHAQAFRKVAENYEALLPDDPGDPRSLGGWSFFHERTTT